VRDELLHSSTPQKVKDRMENLPPWLKIQPVIHFYPIARLHKGETAALQLALQTRTSVILMDDLDGRAAARRLGLTRLSLLEGVMLRKSLKIKSTS
jgi:predicted nucleic acid-binding protein